MAVELNSKQLVNECLYGLSPKPPWYFFFLLGNQTAFIFNLNLDFLRCHSPLHKKFSLKVKPPTHVRDSQSDWCIPHQVLTFLCQGIFIVMFYYTVSKIIEALPSAFNRSY